MIAILARSQNNVLGKDNKIPWKCKEDFRFFRKTTMGKKIAVGKLTYLDLPILPNRTIYILSQSPMWGDVERKMHYDESRGGKVAGVEYDISALPDDVIICGGAQIYKAAIPHCDCVYLTTIKEDVEGDTFFDPEWMKGFLPTDVIEEGDNYIIEKYVKVEKVF